MDKVRNREEHFAERFARYRYNSSRYNSSRKLHSWLVKIIIHSWTLPFIILSFSQSNNPIKDATRRAGDEKPQSMMMSKRKPIAYALSLIKCGDFQSNIGGLVDAATVLAYSVYHHSARHPSSNSKYDFKLYAIVHKQAESCSGTLRDLGFEILLRDPPVTLEEMSSASLRKHAPRAWCCGEAEFIKLYAYTLLEHDIVVHLDIDFLITKPMDDLYDSMLLDPHSAEGQAARSKIPLERPTDPWPDNIEAFVTRDWGQVIPGRKPGFQAGFVVLRPSISIFEQVLDTIRQTDYDGGYSHENGWEERDMVRLSARLLCKV